MRKELQGIILQYISASHAQLIHSHDDVFLTDKILSLLKEEIKKSLLIDEEIQKIWLRHPASALRTKTGAKRAVAQAQVNNTLKIVEEK